MAAVTLAHPYPQVPYSLWDASRAHCHIVQFYRNDSFLLEQLAQFIAPAISSGSAVLLIATKAHRDALFAHMRKCGPDFALAVAKARFLLLDANETLAKFMVKGQPDPVLFHRVIGDRMTQLAAAAEKPNQQIFAFGEMVPCLWAEGKRDAALRLEDLWNQLADKHAFQLLCAFPMQLFSQERDREALEKICALHSRVIPVESASRAPGIPDQLHSFLLLQQKSLVLESEVLERKRLQRALREHETELGDFFENAAIAMQWLASDGTILWANKASLALLGLECDEYIGHHISEFLTDGHRAQNLLQRLAWRLDVHGYEARLTRKDGSSRNVRIDSNAFLRNGRYVHTRCFITDVASHRPAKEKTPPMPADLSGEINDRLQGIANVIHLAALQPDLCENARQHLTVARQELGRVAHIMKQTVAGNND